MEVKFGQPAFCITFLIVTIVHTNEGSFFDFIPVVSQAKPLFQIIGGSADGVRHSQERLTRTNPVADVHVVRPSIEVPTGNPEPAGDIWRVFKDIASTVVKSEQNVGHEITVGHYTEGNREYDNPIIKDSTTRTKRPTPEPDTLSRRPSPDGGNSTERPNLLRHPDPENTTDVVNEQLREIENWENVHIDTDGQRNNSDTYNCTYCTLAGLGRSTVDRIIYLVNLMNVDRLRMAVCIQELGTIFKRAGYEGVSIRPIQQVGHPDYYTHVQQHPIGTMLENSLERGQTVECGLVFTKSDGGHIGVLKAWKNLLNGFESRLIDFQTPKDVYGRLVKNGIPNGNTFLIHLGDEGGDGSEFESVLQNNSGWIRLTTAARGRSYTMHQNAIVKTKPEVSNQGGWFGMSMGKLVGNNLCGNEGQRCRFDTDCCSEHFCFDAEHYTKAWTCFDSRSSSEEDVKPELNAVCGKQGQRCRSDGDCCSILCFGSDHYTNPWTCLERRNSSRAESLGILGNRNSDHSRSVADDRPVRRVHGPTIHPTETTTLPDVSIHYGGWFGMSVANKVEKNLCGNQGQRCRFDKDCCAEHLCFDAERYSDAWTCFDARSSSEEDVKTELNALCGNQGQRCRSGGDCCSNVCFDSDDVRNPWTCSG